MRILAVSDVESKLYWDYYERGMLDDIDLIISCGDLDPRYLSFLVTMASVPVIYVHGNHDTKYESVPPEGCVCIEDDIYVYQGVRIHGLGGSMRYKPGVHQYKDREMQKDRNIQENRKIRKDRKTSPLRPISVLPMMTWAQAGQSRNSVPTWKLLLL